MKTNADTKTENQSESEDSDSDSSSSSSSGDSSDSEDSEDDQAKVTRNKKPNSAAIGKKPKNEQSTPKTNLDLLLSLDEDITGLYYEQRNEAGKLDIFSPFFSTHFECFSRRIIDTFVRRNFVSHGSSIVF